MNERDVKSLSLHWGVWLLGRAATVAAVLLGAVVLVLAMVHLAPGDALDAQGIPDSLRPVLAAEWHLDEPVWRRVILQTLDLIGGDLGTSAAVRPGSPVWEVISKPALRSAGWLGAAFALSLALGAGLAVLPARPRRFARAAMGSISLLPVFLLAHLAVHTLNEGAFTAIQAGWIARPAWFALPDQDSSLRTGLAVVLLATGSAAWIEVFGAAEHALTRARRSPWATAVRARGEPLAPHLRRHLALALTTQALHHAAFLMGGLVILEKVLLLHGAGFILWDAALLRDSPVVAAITLLAATALSLIRWGGDALRVLLDPRLRRER